ncbi:hypothetical protein SK128_013600 [Halocaridina rubra]|uniref:Methuselah N-terminal domain-containing protein n=1 Tax=Halocaridina rubra TaxID=373956 RepID=A0AAN8ZWP8_HALRR
MVALRLLGVLAVLALASNCVNSVEEDYYYEYGDLVEHYPDYIASHTYSIIQPHVDNTTLKKCFCNVDQVWNGSFCHETGTLVLVSNFHIDSAVPVNTSAFGSASVGEVTCPEGTLHFELGKNFSEYDHFYILDTGSLYWNEGIFDNYCVENIYGYNGLPNDWFAQICLEAPVIPKCCPEGYAFDDNGNCVESLVNGVFSPPVYVAGHKQFWPKVTTHGISNPLCEESEETHIVDLDNKNAVLYYDPKMALLVWESPFTLRDQDFIHKYCVVTRQDENLETNYVAKLCYLSRMKDHEEKCRNRTCVRKCCASHETASLGCAPVDPTSDMPIFQPVFHHSTNHSAGAKKPEDLTIVHGFPLCKEYFMLRPHEEENDKFYLLTNGYLHAPSFSNDFPPTRYCLDTFTEGNKSHLLPLICFGDEDSTHNICESVKKYLYPILLLTSVGFLAITVIVYISVPELHAKVHGKCLVSHVTALLVAYASLFIVQKTTDSLSEFGCKFMASVTHISFLAAFFWLNVMCFDIWWTLNEFYSELRAA